MVMRRWLVGCALVAAFAASCTLFDEEPPDDSCASDVDCFRAQGEVCNQQTMRCEMRRMDAGVDAP